MAALPGTPCKAQISRVLMSLQIQRHPKGFWSLPMEAQYSPAFLPGICVSEELKKKDAVEVCYYLFMGNS